MTSNSNKPEHMMDELEWLQYKREQTSLQLKASRRRMKEGYRRLTQPTPATSGMERFMHFAMQGKSILQGLKTGYKIIGIASMLFGLRKFSKK